MTSSTPLSPRPRDFTLERFLARFEFTAPHMLSASDCEPMTVGALLDRCGVGPEALLDLSLGYTDAEGSPWLRERIAGFYPGLGPDDILVTNAPEEAIFIAMTAMLGPGDRVVVQTPCYQALGEIARWRGAEVVSWPMREGADGWQVDLDQLDALLGIPTKLLVVNLPHNPTGWLPTRAEHEDLMALAERHGVRVFSDEMYRGLEHDPADALSPAASVSERALSLWGMSKAFGLGGLRIGWLATRDRALKRELLGLKDYTTICASAPGERLAHLALGQHQAITRGHVATIRHNVELARAFGERSGALAWRAPRAGSVAFPRWLPGG
ncbi:MAG: pyridoxal phosphate-dependent aminotransferase, partial [Myxococcota bacterium]